MIPGRKFGRSCCRLACDCCCSPREKDDIRRLTPPVTGGLPPPSSLVLRPLGLVALSDELRAEAGAVLEALAAQGIHFKILSGDNPETVRATVGHLRLPLAREPVVSGDQLAVAPDAAEMIRTRS